jgi:hypothetical protein
MDLQSSRVLTAQNGTTTLQLHVCLEPYMAALAPFVQSKLKVLCLANLHTHLSGPPFSSLHRNDAAVNLPQNPPIYDLLTLSRFIHVS